jgi:hypothetical protein
LRGEEGVSRFRFRQQLLALTARGRLGQGLRAWLRRVVLPPDVLVRYRHPELHGPYAWRLLRGRLPFGRAKMGPHQRK